MASQEDTKIPITERANLVTSNIDIAEVNEIVELVQKAENEIFQEWYENEPGVINTSVLAKIDTLVKNVAELINKNSEDVKVILSGMSNLEQVEDNIRETGFHCQQKIQWNLQKDE